MSGQQIYVDGLGQHSMNKLQANSTTFVKPNKSDLRLKRLLSPVQVNIALRFFKLDSLPLSLVFGTFLIPAVLKIKDLGRKKIPLTPSRANVATHDYRPNLLH